MTEVELEAVATLYTQDDLAGVASTAVMLYVTLAGLEFDDERATEDRDDVLRGAREMFPGIDVFATKMRSDIEAARKGESS